LVGGVVQRGEAVAISNTVLGAMLDQQTADLALPLGHRHTMQGKGKAPLYDAHKTTGGGRLDTTCT
jgi:hypothetical protein